MLLAQVHCQTLRGALHLVCSAWSPLSTSLEGRPVLCPVLCSGPRGTSLLPFVTQLTRWCGPIPCGCPWSRHPLVAAGGVCPLLSLGLPAPSFALRHSLQALVPSPASGKPFLTPTLGLPLLHPSCSLLSLPPQGSVHTDPLAPVPFQPCLPGKLGLCSPLPAQHRFPGLDPSVLPSTPRWSVLLPSTCPFTAGRTLRAQLTLCVPSSPSVTQACTGVAR